MNVHELRDPDDARRFIQQGLWLQARLAPTAGNVRTYLEWALEIASSGEPLPPIGFLADIGAEAFDLGKGQRRSQDQAVPGALNAGLARAFDDHVLGKIFADWTFERARDALKSYAPGREQARGLAFLINQFRVRSQFDGVLLSPSVIRGLIDAAPEDTLRRGRESLRDDGLMPVLAQCYESMVASARRTAEVLSEADVRALENRIALADAGQRLAHEQVIRAMIELRNALPAHRLRPLAGRHEVPTRVLDEDTYPVGGFSSISTRGSIESLLHSQLAYIEDHARPDLFDIKYVRDELYYYARDENQFLRRRRNYVFAFYPDLVQARLKDPEMDFQRIVYLLGFVLAAIEKLTDWLSADALTFDLVFLPGDEAIPLRHEYELLEMLLREPIDHGTIRLHPTPRSHAGARPDAAAPAPLTEDYLTRLCRARAQRSLCQLLTISTEDRPLAPEETTVARLCVDSPRPALAHNDAQVPEALEWSDALERVLQLWV